MKTDANYIIKAYLNVGNISAQGRASCHGSRIQRQKLLVCCSERQRSLYRCLLLLNGSAVRLCIVA